MRPSNSRRVMRFAGTAGTAFGVSIVAFVCYWAALGVWPRGNPWQAVSLVLLFHVAEQAWKVSGYKHPPADHKAYRPSDENSS